MAASRAIKESRFTGKKAQFLDIMAPSGVAFGRIVLAGIGKDLDENDQQALGGGFTPDSIKRVSKRRI